MRETILPPSERVHGLNQRGKDISTHDGVGQWLVRLSNGRVVTQVGVNECMRTQESHSGAFKWFIRVIRVLYSGLGIRVIRVFRRVKHPDKPNQA